MTAVVRMAVDPGPIRVGYGLFFLSFSFFIFINRDGHQTASVNL